jgi:hypothetical protein
MVRFKNRLKLMDVSVTWTRPTITYGLVACFISET